MRQELRDGFLVGIDFRVRVRGRVGLGGIYCYLGTQIMLLTLWYGNHKTVFDHRAHRMEKSEGRVASLPVFMQAETHCCTHRRMGAGGYIFPIRTTHGLSRFRDPMCLLQAWTEGVSFRPSQELGGGGQVVKLFCL